MASSTALEVPMKFEIVRNGVVEEVRRRRLVSPSFEVLSKVVKELARGRYRIEYIDEDGDNVTMDTEEEWEECLCLWKQLNTLRLRIVLLSSSPMRSRSPRLCGRNRHCRWGGRQQSDSEGQPQDLLQQAARWWCSQRKAQEDNKEPWWLPKGVVGEPCVGCKTYKATNPDACGHCCLKCMWTGGARHGRHCVKQLVTDEEGTQEASLELVKKALEQLRGNGQEVLSQILEGKTDAKTLGCDAWLTIVKLDNGDADLNVDVTALRTILMKKGLEAMDVPDKKAAVELFELCTEIKCRAGQQAASWYNLACAKLMGHSEKVAEAAAKNEKVSDEVQQEMEKEQQEALDALEKAVELGYRAFRRMFCDPDLAVIKDNERFQALFPLRAQRWVHRAAAGGKCRGRHNRNRNSEPEGEQSVPEQQQSASSPPEVVEASESPKESAPPSELPRVPTVVEEAGETTPLLTEQSSTVQTEGEQPQQQQVEEQPQQEQPHKYAEQIKLLQEMGLMQPNAAALVEQFSGDLNQVIAAMMQ